MSSPKIVNALKRHKCGLFLLILYIPISCSLIGILAYYMRLPIPVSGSHPFRDVFRFYANPLNSDFSSVHLPALVLSFAYLLYMIISVNTPKPIITIFHIRVFLLILIVLITTLVVVSNVIVPFSSIEFQSSIRLFLYVDVHLIFIFLLTYLPIFRKLKAKLV